MTLFLFSAIPAAILSYILTRKLELQTHVLKPGTLFIFFGILSGFCVSIINSYYDNLNVIPTNNIDTLFYAIFNVGLIEEFWKFCFFQFALFFIISDELKTRNVVILFSSMIGLGFALIENVSYAQTYGYDILLSRSLIAMPMHMSFGFFIGWFLTSDTKYKILLAIGSVTLLHGIYDFWAFKGYRIATIITFAISMQIMFSQINKLKANGK
jgi:RsiW-degrading membrane proteinase PrsW (M82 family)